LTPAFRASGPHDFAVRDECRSSRAKGARDIIASTASCPNVRDDSRDAPLMGQDGGIMQVIWDGVKKFSVNRKIFGGGKGVIGLGSPVDFLSVLV
jgi:hypothetical protein